MLSYRLSLPSAYPHLVPVCIEIPTAGRAKIVLRMSAWRPGRYELANYAKNVVGFQTVGKDDSQPLIWRKLERNLWEVECEGIETLEVSYGYYARQFDSGACYATTKLLYINPVNALMFEEAVPDQPSLIHLEIPDEWLCGTSLKEYTGASKTLNVRTFEAENWEELAESPFLAAAQLTYETFEAANVKYHVWAWGRNSLDFQRFCADCERYTVEQTATMGPIPVEEFHYLCLFPHHKQHHGVEHTKSTVLTIGPGLELDQQALYEDLLGVASHELFHVWNVKTIRPAEMLPYDFTKENYAETGFIYEGVTTYYGDLFLVRSGVYTRETYYGELDKYLKRHTLNYGREFMGVLEASSDTWVDGYMQSAPHRKTNIYVEGLMAALILDIHIRKETNNKSSLDDLMRAMQSEFGGLKQGYTKEDYFRLAEAIIGHNLGDFEVRYLKQSVHLWEGFEEALGEMGLLLAKRPTHYLMNHFGLELISIEGKCCAESVAPNSPAAAAMIAEDCEILSINGLRPDMSLLAELGLEAYQKRELTITWLTELKEVMTARIEPNELSAYFHEYQIVEDINASSEQLAFREKWLSPVASIEA